MAQVAQTLLAGSDVLLVGALIGPAAAVPYACTAKLIQVLANHPQMLMQAAAPALSEMRMSESAASASRRPLRADARDARDERRHRVRRRRGQPGLRRSGGSDPRSTGGPRSRWCSSRRCWPGTSTRRPSTPCSASATSGGSSITAVADGFVTVVTALVLVPHYGLLGVAIASLVGVVTVSYVPNLRLLAREIGVPLLYAARRAARLVRCASFSARRPARALAAIPLGHGLPSSSCVLAERRWCTRSSWFPSR